MAKGDFRITGQDGRTSLGTRKGALYRLERENILSIVREDQVLVSPRDVIERCKEIFPRAADSAFDRILAEFEGEGVKV